MLVSVLEKNKQQKRKGRCWGQSVIEILLIEIQEGLTKRMTIE